jgi:hypothetical protein
MGIWMASESGLPKVAGDMDALLSEVILLQQDYVARVCPSCEKPCCTRVQELFDEKDMIFAKASGRNGAPLAIPGRMSSHTQGPAFCLPSLFVFQVERGNGYTGAGSGEQVD